MSAQTAPPPPQTLPNKSGFSDAVLHRRSVYALMGELPSGVSDRTIEGLIKDAVLHVPSAFNSQTSRCVLLLKSEHQKFWNGAIDVFKGKMDEETFQKTKGRLEGFAKAYGSILFFEDGATVKKMQERTPAYANLFPQWSEHTTGMHQFVLWTALQELEVGANLQHYHMEPAVEEFAKKTWDLPEAWGMKAQLVFGAIAPDGYPKQAKEKLPTNETVRVYGA